MITMLGFGSTRTPIGAVRFALTEGGAIAALEFEDLWDARVRRLGKRFGDDVRIHVAQGGCGYEDLRFCSPVPLHGRL